VLAHGTRDLRLISNNCGAPGHGLYRLLEAGRVRAVVASYIGDNKLFEDLVLAGSLDLELVPQGTLAERIRAGGAGIPAFYTATGVGTVIADGKTTTNFDGRDYILERGLRADLSLIRANCADSFGNLVFRKTARNFNAPMATAGETVVVECEKLEPVGTIDGDHVHVSGAYVDRVVGGITYPPIYEKLVERKGPIE
jgi:3-oxoacid CoA-transferase subunit A